MDQHRVIKVGNAAGFWGDQADAPCRLVEQAELDYLTLEYLAELTLSILAHQKSKDPSAGFAKDFPKTIEALAPALKSQPNLKIVTNAGGMNPTQCARHVAQVLAEQGLDDIRIAAVEGDDLMPRLLQMHQDGESFTNLETQQPLSDLDQPVVSANAYLGAPGIVAALEAGARIVITGRVADASLLVGPAAFEFNWSMNDWERLGKATVAGHLIECGAQVTGGIDSSWSPGLDLTNVGYPIATLDESGDSIISKPEGTTGRVTTRTVAEQLIYEIGDPQRYYTPDVTADFRNVTLTQVGADRIRVEGGTGTPPPETLKVSMAYYDGFMISGTLVIAGHNAVEKARAAAEMIRGRLELAGIKLKRFSAEVLGSGDSCGRAVTQTGEPWEVVLRVAAQDPSRDALERLGRELAPLVTSGPPGVTGYTGARSRPHRVLSFWPTSLSRKLVEPVVAVDSAANWSQSMEANE